MCYEFYCIERSVGPIITKCGFTECEGLDRIGRFSYNKFNKEVEVFKLLFLILFIG